MRTTAIKAALLLSLSSLTVVACAKTPAPAPGGSDMAAMLSVSAPNPLDKPFTLKDSKEVDVPALLASLDATDAIKYDNASFDSKTGATVLTNVRLSDPTEGSTTIGRVELYGLNTDMIASLQADAPIENLEELFRKIRLFDVSGSFNQAGTYAANGEPLKANMTIGAVEIDTLKLASLGAEAEAAISADPNKSFASAMQRMEFGGMALKDMDLVIPQMGGAGADIGVADMRFGGYAAGALGGMLIKGLEYKMTQTDESVAAQLGAMGGAGAMFAQGPLRNLLFPKEQSGTVAVAKWDGMTFAGLLPYLEKGEKPPADAMGLIRVGGMKFTDQVTFVNGKKAGAVPETVLEPIEFMQYMPLGIRMTSKGATGDLTAYADETMPELLAILKKNGLDKVKGDSSVVFAYDPKTKAMGLNMDADAAGLYGFSFDLDIADFDYVKLAGASAEDPSASQQAIMSTAIKGMSLRLSDEKMLDTIFAIAGLQTQQEASALRAQAAGFMTMAAVQGAQVSPRIPTYSSALASFLQEGGSLEVKIAPAAQVSFGDMSTIMGAGNPGAVLDQLNLTVERKAK